MIADTLLITPAVESTASDFATFGAVHLDVTDGERALRFWRDLVGLELLSATGSEIRLGAGGRDLVVLHPGASTPSPRAASGLYHMALHLPSLAEFARVVARADAARYPHFLTDHLTHFADYIDDPDGIGLELAFETPQCLRGIRWGAHGPELIDAAGRSSDGREQIDLQWLLSHAPDDHAPAPLPAGATVGHVHFRVADIEDALAFYRDVLGFTTNMHWPPGGMSDMSAGGIFPHRIAMNIWESAGLPQRPAGAAGLRHATLVLRSVDDLREIMARADATGCAIARSGVDATVSDPSGNRWLLTVAPS